MSEASSDFPDEMASEPGDESDAETLEELVMEPATDEDFAEVEDWVGEDQQASPVEVDETPPNNQPESAAAKIKSWTLRSAGSAVAYSQLRSRNGVGNLLFIVKPSMRGHGLGRELLHRVEHRPDLDVFILKVFVDRDNIPGQRVLIASGYKPFAKIGRLIEFRKRIVKAK